ncbi:hypothetical protein JKP88DRAFT_351464 [Tribonema minus]|uniref:Uncharacterized protein n=1 Tax=Tribonema minus TaxID=303371 RepID=A0A835YKU3_9STRA|nr:hypothetical protein JKP88DRAFT_351464 [Tribonema minus]
MSTPQLEVSPVDVGDLSPKRHASSDSRSSIVNTSPTSPRPEGTPVQIGSLTLSAAVSTIYALNEERKAALAAAARWQRRSSELEAQARKLKAQLAAQEHSSSPGSMNRARIATLLQASEMVDDIATVGYGAGSDAHSRCSPLESRAACAQPSTAVKSEPSTPTAAAKAESGTPASSPTPAEGSTPVKSELLTQLTSAHGVSGMAAAGIRCSRRQRQRRKRSESPAPAPPASPLRPPVAPTALAPATPPLAEQCTHGKFVIVAGEGSGGDSEYWVGRVVRRQHGGAALAVRWYTPRAGDARGYGGALHAPRRLTAQAVEADAVLSVFDALAEGERLPEGVHAAAERWLAEACGGSGGGGGGGGGSGGSGGASGGGGGGDGKGGWLRRSASPDSCAALPDEPCCTRAEAQLR